MRRKLGEDAEDPTYIFTELRVGYRISLRLAIGGDRENVPIVQA